MTLLKMTIKNHVHTTPCPFPPFGSAPTTTGSPSSSGFSLTYTDAKKNLCIRDGKSAVRCCLFSDWARA